MTHQIHELEERPAAHQRNEDLFAVGVSLWEKENLDSVHQSEENPVMGAVD